MAVTDLTRGVYRRLYSGATRGRRINSVSEGAELLFWRLVMIADDLGNLHADPMLIRSDAMPLRSVTNTTIKKRMNELERVGLIERYLVKGESYAHIVGWSDLQPMGYDENRNRKRPIQRYPAPHDADEKRSATKGNDDVRSDTDTEHEHETEHDTAAPTSSGSKLAAAVAWSSSSGWTGITDEHRQRWAEAYPACNLDRQLAAMDTWLRANPAKARKSRWEKFITNWLSRSQDRGGDVGSAGHGHQPRKPPTDDELRSQGIPLTQEELRNDNR